MKGEKDLGALNPDGDAAKQELSEQCSNQKFWHVAWINKQENIEQE